MPRQPHDKATEYKASIAWYATHPDERKRHERINDLEIDLFGRVIAAAAHGASASRAPNPSSPVVGARKRAKLTATLDDVLRTLAVERLLNREITIGLVSERMNDTNTRNIGTKLRRLTDAGMVERSRGRKGIYVLTEEGRERAGTLIQRNARARAAPTSRRRPRATAATEKTMAAQIRDAMKALGGKASVRQLAERLGWSHKDVSGALNAAMHKGMTYKHGGGIHGLQPPPEGGTSNS